MDSILEPDEGEMIIIPTCLSFDAPSLASTGHAFEVSMTLNVSNRSTALDGVDFRLPSPTVSVLFDTSTVIMCVNVTIIGNDEFNGNRKAIFFLTGTTYILVADLIILNILEDDGKRMTWE